MVSEEMIRRRLVPLVQDGVLLVSEIRVSTSSMGRATVQVSVRKAPTSKLAQEKVDALAQEALADLDVALIVHHVE